MSYSDSFPSSSPVFQANFAANGGRIDPRATFTRSDTPPTYAAPSAVHYWSNEKHESSQNLVEYSSDISNGYWTKQGVSPTGGQTAPDGGTDAYKLTEDAATSDHRIYHLFGATPTDATTITFFAKYIGRQWIYVRAKDSGGTNRYCWLDIQNGVVGTVQTNVTASIAASGNGYYKCTVVLASAIASGQSLNIGGAAADGDGGGYAGLNGDAFAVWGIQASTTGETVLNETNGQIHRSYAPTLKSVSYAGQPRFEYDPTDGQSIAKGILIEGSATNLLNRSEEFDNAYWSKSTGGTSPAINLTITPNAAISPSGELTADLVVPQNTGGNTLYFISKTYSFTSGNTYTLSAFVKSAGLTEFTLAAGNTATWAASTRFTLTGSGSASVSSGSATIESCGNGWYRCAITGTAGATTSTNLLLQCVSGGQNSFDGDDYSGVLLWGAQMETGAASSYIKVEGSTVTRASESLSMTDSSLFGTGSGAVVVEAGPVSGTFYPTLFDLTDTTTSNRVLLQSGGTGTPTSLTVAADGSGSVGVVSEAVTMSDRKFAISYDTNSFKLVNNGGAVSEDTSGQLPQQLSKLNIGTDNGGGGPLNGHIKRIAVFGEPLSNSNLQAITS